MHITAPPAFYTAATFWEWITQAEKSNKRLFLLDGEIYEMPPTGWLHGSFTSKLNHLIEDFVTENNLGSVTAAETGYQLSDHTVLAPDVGFIAAARVPTPLPDGFVPFAPDLAIEVVSPSNSASEIHAKVEQYIQHGTRLVWIIYPKTQKVAVYRATSDKEAILEFIDQAGVLDGGEILPNFALPLSYLFPPTSE